MRLNPKLLVGLGLLVIAAYFLKDLVFSDSQYAAGILKERKAKNDAFRLSGSPLSSTQRDMFDSLHYFSPNKAYRLTTRLEPFATRDTVAMPLTHGTPEKYLRWGKATFTWQNQPQQLTLFLKADGRDSTLFIPFTDRSNGFGSYGGGRYLDAPKPAPGDNSIVLDFNQTYNPYCAYSDDYACPVPPSENRLTFAVKAGEKAFHD